jgi:hypothetical protein
VRTRSLRVRGGQYRDGNDDRGEDAKAEAHSRGRCYDVATAAHSA